MFGLGGVVWPVFDVDCDRILIFGAWFDLAGCSMLFVVVWIGGRRDIGAFSVPSLHLGLRNLTSRLPGPFKRHLVLGSYCKRSARRPESRNGVLEEAGRETAG